MQIVPRPFGQVLSDALNALSRVWRPLASTALIVFIPVGVATLFVFQWVDGATDFLDLVFSDPESLQGLSDGELFELARPFLMAMAISSGFQTLATVFIYLAAARAMTFDAAGLAVSGRELRAHATRRYLSAFIAALVALLGIGSLLGLGLGIWMIPVGVVGLPNSTSVLIAFVLLVALVAPGVWLGVSMSTFLAVLAAERVGPISSLRRSIRLVRGRWWPTLGFLALVGLLGAVAVQLIQLVAIPLAAAGVLDSGISLASVLGIVSQGLIIAGYGAMYAAWYVDLRARSDALTADDLS